MKFIRLLLTILELALVLAVVLALAAFVPIVQTWVAQAALAGHHGVTGSVDLFSAEFGRIEATNLHLEADGAVLTLPSLEARLPITSAVFRRKVQVRSLVAQGWKLDLSHAASVKPAQMGPAGGPDDGSGRPRPAAEAAPAQAAERAFRGILSRWKLPCDLSLDGVDLEGDVLVATAPGVAPAQIHVVIKGGGLAAGREGRFSLEASGTDPWLPVANVATHGQLVAAMDSPRTFRHLGITGDLSTTDGSLPEGYTVSADIAAAGTAQPETYTLDLSHGDRKLVTLVAGCPEGAPRLAGNWQVDLRDGDLAPFLADHPLPPLTVTGEGKFDSDAAGARVHVSGRLHGVARHLGMLAPPLDLLGATTLDARFDLTRRGPSIGVDQLEGTIQGERSSAAVRTLQAFAIDERTGTLTAARPGADWAEGSLRGLPLAWLSGHTAGFTITGGDAAGAFSLRLTHDGWAVAGKTPLTATGVSVQRAGRMLARGLAVSLSLQAEQSAQGWTVQAAPLEVSSDGRRLARIDAKVSQAAGDDQPLAIAGTWSADLGALATQPGAAENRWIAGRSASGDFSGSLGTAAQVEVKVAVAGRDPGHTVTADLQVTTDGAGTLSFVAPLKLSRGAHVSDVSAEGTWTQPPGGNDLELKLTGENVAWDDLRLLAAALAPAGDQATDPGARDHAPFWGDWIGRIGFAFDHLHAGAWDFTDAAGTFDFDHQGIQFENGRGGLPPHRQAKAAGTLTYEAGAEFPYRLSATTALDRIDAAEFMGPPPAVGDPWLEGHFALASTLAGRGRNPGDLLAHTQEEFRLTGQDGILRLLKTNVADAIPQVGRPVADTAGQVGSFVGSLLGVERDGSKITQNIISKSAEAVLDFTYQVGEFGYDELAVTAVRAPDRSIRLQEVTVTAPEIRLTGSGQITAVPGQPVWAGPLRLNLVLGVQGRSIPMLTTAGLLPASPPKDSQGYVTFPPALHFGGSLEHPDASAWHDLLAQTAARDSVVPKKSAAP